MRKIRGYSYSEVDTQMALHGLSETLAEAGIAEEDVISVQRIWNDDPMTINGSKRDEDKAWVTMIAYCWA